MAYVMRPLSESGRDCARTHVIDVIAINSIELFETGAYHPLTAWRCAINRYKY
jgi:hypothetical protein